MVVGDVPCEKRRGSLHIPLSHHVSITATHALFSAWPLFSRAAFFVPNYLPDAESTPSDLDQHCGRCTTIEHKMAGLTFAHAHLHRIIIPARKWDSA